MGKLPVKYFKLNDKSKGVFAMGLVGKPAIEEDWVKLGKKKPTNVFKLKTLSEEKRIVTGFALVPEIDIYREDSEGNAYNLRFDAETIVELSHGLIRNQNQSNTTIDHDFKIDGVHLCESWIVSDLVHDKSVALGLEPKLGAWVTSYKIDSDEVWNEYIKTGLVKGFSIEAVEGELSKQLNINKMSKPNLLERAKTLLAELVDGEVKLMEFVTEDGAVVLVADAIEVGKPLFIKGEADAENVAAPDGEYVLADKSKVIAKDGVIESVEVAVAAPTEEELAAKAEAEKLEATELAAKKQSAEKLDAILTMLEKQKEVVTLTKEDIIEIVKTELKALPTQLSKPGAPIKKDVKKLSQHELASMSVRERTAYLALN